VKAIKFFTCLLLLAPVQTIYAQNFWEQTSGPPNGTVWAIGINEEDIIYAADNAVLYHSKDDGDTWEFVKDWSTEANEIVSIVFNDSGHIFVGTFGGAGVYYSTDGGDNWLLPAFALPEVNAITIGHNGDIIAATMLNVWISTDNGYTWVLRNNGLPPHTIVMSVFVDGEDNYFIGTYSAEERIYKSTDFGMSWLGAGNGVGFIAVISFEQIGKKVLFAGSSDALGIHRSSNGGSDWEYINNGLPVTAADYKLKANNVDHIFAGLTTGGVYKSSDTGDTWDEFNSGLSLNAIISLEINSKGVLFAGTDGNGVFRTVQSTLSLTTNSKNIPDDFYLLQNFPNPFNLQTNFKFGVPEEDRVEFTIYDSIGRRIKTLLDRILTAGDYEINFNASNLPTGIYFASIHSQGFKKVIKMILLK
jgi:ligand-binding sensor domain-containing protein